MNDWIKVLLLVAFLLIVGLIQFIPGEAPAPRQPLPPSNVQSTGD